MIPLIIALNTLKLAFRQREAVFWIFIGPLIFVTFFGILFKAQPRVRRRSTSSTRIAPTR